MIDTLLSILTSPYIQFFILAVLAGFFRSDLELPEQVTKALSMYLMMAIGLKGGIAIRDSEVPIGEIAGVLLSGVTLGFLIPFIGYFLLRKTTQLSRIDAAAISAHYGSVSVVTFSYAISYLRDHGYDYAGYIVTLMALMESPAILAGLILARESKQLKDKAKKRLFSGEVIRDALLNGSIVLLLGSMMIGITAAPEKLARIEPYLIAPFGAVLCVFLLDLGLITARQLSNVRLFTLSMVLFAFYMPLIGMTLGIGASLLLGLALPEMMIFATLCASASYIAVPAAFRIALPKANPALYVTSSLALTFPFNLLIGIPVYYAVSKWALGL